VRAASRWSRDRQGAVASVVRWTRDRQGAPTTPSRSTHSYIQTASAAKNRKRRAKTKGRRDPKTAKTLQKPAKTCKNELNPKDRLGSG